MVLTFLFGVTCIYTIVRINKFYSMLYVYLLCNPHGWIEFISQDYYYIDAWRIRNLKVFLFFLLVTERVYAHITMLLCTYLQCRKSSLDLLLLKFISSASVQLSYIAAVASFTDDDNILSSVVQIRFSSFTAKPIALLWKKKKYNNSTVNIRKYCAWYWLHVQWTSLYLPSKVIAAIL